MHLILSEILACTIAGSMTAAAALIVRSRMKRYPARVNELLWIPVWTGYILPFALRITPALWKYPSALTRACDSIVHFFVPASPFLTAVWLLGLAVTALISLIRFVQLSRRVSDSTSAGNGIRVAPAAESPITIGLLHPAVILPEGLSEEETKYILLHENAHRRRFDPVKKLVVYIIVLLHWINPLVWYLFSVYETDLEMACDEAAAAPLSRNDRARYAMTLLYYKPNGMTPLINAWKSRDSVMKQRIANITSDRTMNSTKRIITALCTAVLFLSAFLAPYGTHAAVQTEQEETVEVILPQEYLTRNGRWPEDDAEYYLSFFLPESLSRIDHTLTDADGRLHLFLRQSCYERQLAILEQSVRDFSAWYAENSNASVNYDPQDHLLSVTSDPEDFSGIVTNMLIQIYEYEAWKTQTGEIITVTVDRYTPEGNRITSYAAENYDTESLREVSR